LAVRGLRRLRVQIQVASPLERVTGLTQVQDDRTQESAPPCQPLESLDLPREEGGRISPDGRVDEAPVQRDVLVPLHLEELAQRIGFRRGAVLLHELDGLLETRRDP